MNLLERYEGCMLGLAAGDALGTTLEFSRPGTFTPIHDIVGGGPFRLKPGQWTDDTSMAMCLAESLLACDGFDAADQMTRYVRWRKDGYWSSTGRCFDIGNGTAGALSRFEDTGDAFAGSHADAGNGCLMRLAPAPLFFRANTLDAIIQSGESARTTHGAPEAITATRYFAGLLLGILQGRSKDDVLSPRFNPTSDATLWETHPLDPKIVPIADGSFRRKEPPVIQGGGYVVPALEAALWAFAKGSNCRECVCLAVNLGDDADTTGAICGQLAGAYYGIDDIPAKWRKILARGDDIRDLARRIFTASEARTAK